jgi:hypothetical protein
VKFDLSSTGEEAFRVVGAVMEHEVFVIVDEDHEKGIGFRPSVESAPEETPQLVAVEVLLIRDPGPEQKEEFLSRATLAVGEQREIASPFGGEPLLLAIVAVESRPTE